jgi:hypothetical protein
MFRPGRLIGDVFASIGAVLLFAGLVLLMVQCLIWLKTRVWHPMHIRTVLDAIKVSSSQALDVVLQLPLPVVVFVVGVVFIWVAAEVYERQ